MSRKYSRYPWQQYMDGETHDLYRGVHFNVVQASFVSAGYGWASRHGYKIEMHKLGTIGVSVRKIEGPGLARMLVEEAAGKIAQAREQVRQAGPEDSADLDAAIVEAMRELDGLRNDLMW
jgi:hypothetical protein